MNEECCGHQCDCHVDEQGPVVGETSESAKLASLYDEEKQNAKNFNQLCYIGGGLLIILGALLIKIFYVN